MSSFYDRPEWQRLRYRVLRKYGFRCMACQQKGELHVDHIYPVSQYPERALDEDNLQVLCRSCNLGKSNIYIDDHRPKHEPIAQNPEVAELQRLVGTVKTAIGDAEKTADEGKVSRLVKLYLDIMRHMKGEFDSRAALIKSVRAIIDDRLGSA